MPMNPVKGNMYDFVTHTWNAIKGKCPHGCSYCYMRQERLKSIRLDEKEFKTDLGSGNFIFVGSSCDMWAWTVPEEWITRTLKPCREHYLNEYLFQSKNPQRFRWFYHSIPTTAILGTTIESNREYPDIYKDAPPIVERYGAMFQVGPKDDGCEVMITIEPILDFDLKEFVEMIRDIEPKWVNIGANTYFKIKLPEPPAEKIRALIEELKGFTEVKLKKNLKRLLGRKS